MKINEVYLIDRMEGLKKYADKSIDLLIDDPPYFTGPNKRRFYGKEINTLNIRRKDYPVTKDWAVPTQEYFDEVFRVSKHQIIWGCNYYKIVWPGSGRIIWDKVNADSSFSDCEVAYCSMHDSVRLVRYMWNGMMQGKSLKEGHIMQGDKSLNEVRIHPTQKPVLLYKWLLDKYAKEGYKILSPHVGSGSDRIACYDYGFDFEGFEIDPTHYHNQQQRYLQHIQQQQLFRA